MSEKSEPVKMFQRQRDLALGALGVARHIATLIEHLPLLGLLQDIRTVVDSEELPADRLMYHGGCATSQDVEMLEILNNARTALQALGNRRSMRMAKAVREASRAI